MRSHAAPLWAVFIVLLSSRMSVLAGPCGLGPMLDVTRDPGRAQLKTAIKYAIGHEGCLAFAGHSLRDAQGLRGCYETKDPGRKCEYGSASDAILQEVTLEAAAEVRREFDTVNMKWVCDTEGLGWTFRARVTANPPDHHFVRTFFERKQSHRSDVRNMLAAWSDDDLTKLVMNDATCPARPPAPAATKTIQDGDPTLRGGDHHHFWDVGGKKPWLIIGALAAAAVVAILIFWRRKRDATR